MAEVPLDNCMHCGKEYALSPETAQLSIFIKNQSCNNVLATCPHCQGVTRIFVSIESTCSLLDTLPIFVYQEPSSETVNGWLSVNVPEPRQEDEVFVSERELKKLARDLNAFEHGVDG